MKKMIFFVFLSIFSFSQQQRIQLTEKYPSLNEISISKAMETKNKIFF